jgi:hypothetical protein
VTPRIPYEPPADDLDEIQSALIDMWTDIVVATVRAKLLAEANSERSQSSEKLARIAAAERPTRTAAGERDGEGQTTTTPAHARTR